MSKLHSILSILLFLLTSTTMSEAQSILDYYKLMSDYDNDIKIHKLTEKEGQWYVQNNNSKIVKIDLDEKNNFLELKDKEEGGIFTLQLSLLKQTKGEVLIAMVKNHMDMFLHGEIHIIKYRNGRFNDITKEVLPEINYQDFTEKTMSIAASAYNADFNKHLEFGYQLPRDGKTAYAEMKTEVIKNKCAQKDSSVSDYCNSLNEIAYSTIELIWNVKEGKFVLGEKK